MFWCKNDTKPLAISTRIPNKFTIKITDNIKIIVIFSKWLYVNM